MSTQPRTSQIKSITASPMIGSAALDTLDTTVTKIDDELAKLFEDRNFLLVDGGTIAVNSGATSVTFTASLKLHVNSLVSGASPSIIDLAATTRVFSADGRMLYAIINRVAATATVVADSATLPTVTSTNQEVVLIAKRIGTVIYFRNGITIPANAVRTMDGNIFTTNNLTVNEIYAEGISNDTTSGSNATLSTPTTPIIRLTAAGTLVSVDMIPAGTPGQSYKYINATGSSINFNNLTGATPANQILTGTNATLSVANNASIIIVYDSISQKNRVIGGSGSGSNGSGINYILSPSADTGSAGWATYADAAGTSPVNGTGGAPNITFTTTTSSPLRGTASFLLTKDAVNRQGEGFSYDFTIDASDKGKVLQCSFEYQIASGTFVDNDLSVWVYDITNSVLIQPAPYLVKNSGIIEKFAVEFQTSSSSTSYRLIVHVGSTSASAYTIKFDNFNLGPQAKLYGSPISDAVIQTTITVGATTTAPTKGTTSVDQITYSRNGARLIADYQYTATGAGSPGTGDYLFTLPAGLSFDSTAVKFYTGALYNNGATGLAASVVGHGSIALASSNGYSGSLILYAYDATRFRAIAIYSNGNAAAANTQLLGSTGLSFSFVMGLGMHVDAPIQGWSSSQIVSSNADTRVVSMRASTSSTAIGTAGAQNTIVFSNVIKDSHGAYNPATGIYTVQIPGDYYVNAEVTFNSTANSSGLAVYKGSTPQANSSNDSTASRGGRISTLVTGLVAGDTLSISANCGTVGRTANGAGLPTGAWAGGNLFEVTRVSGPSQIAASETVSASYWLSANFAASTTTPINFDSREFDSHGAVTTSPTAWKFTAPISGIYSINVFANWATASASYIRIYKNGSYLKPIAYSVSGVQVASGNPSVKLLAGEYIDIRPSASITIAGSGSLGSDAASHIEITRTGNY